jgi:hypothetical protein
MNRIQLHLRHGTEGGGAVVRVSIDGTDLIDLIRTVEQPFASAEGHPEIAGGYDGLTPRDWIELPEQYGEDGRAAVLACVCGEVGCWPLRVRIDTDAAQVTWSQFQQPHRPGWDLSGLGPFVFDRAQYEAELTRIHELARGANG